MAQRMFSHVLSGSHISSDSRTEECTGLLHTEASYEGCATL